jgi:hypothetical protein
MPIENGITQSVTDMRGETSLQEPIESGWNLVCLVSLVFLLRIPGVHCVAQCTAEGESEPISVSGRPG